jgi:DNA polymerase I-like protein with 3'-5' exonuclease and polymerase domains
VQANHNLNQTRQNLGSCMLIALDTEDTGLDLFHGAKPYLITVCDEEGNQQFWEVDVDPLTREPQWSQEDIDHVSVSIGSFECDEIVGQNIKFDARALETIGIKDWPWHKTQDTLIAGHVLASNKPHNLTDMCIQYLGFNIEKYELSLEKACKEARRLCRSKFKDWKIAKPGYPDMPSVKSSATNKEDRAWKFDAWLPRALAKEHNWIVPDHECNHQWDKPDELGHAWVCSNCKGHQWWVILSEYANMDSGATLALWKVMEQKLHERGLWEIYKCMMDLPEIAYEMQGYGVTLNKDRHRALKQEYQEVSEECKALCEGIADSYGYQLSMPNGASPNNSLRHFILNVLNLEPQYAAKGKSDAPTLNKEAMSYYSKTLPDRSKEKLFIDTLLRKRKKDTHIAYLEDYERYWLPMREISNEQTERRCDDKTNAESDKDGNLLDMGRGQIPLWSRPVPGNGGSESTQSKLPTVRGTNTGGSPSATQMRQSLMREAGTPVSRDTQGQFGGHGKEEQTSGGGKKRISDTPGISNEGGGLPCGEANTGTSEGDKADIHKGKPNTRGRSTSKDIRSKESDDMQSSQGPILEACDLTQWYKVHPNLNSTGSDTLRWSSSCPNIQNVSTQEDEDGRSLRYVYGPAPGREWWDLDAKNIELRIPAYVAGEMDMIALFERPDDPPYYGSNHLLIAHILFPEEFEEGRQPDDTIDGRLFKKNHLQKYKRVKNGNFAVQYGAINRDDGMGTADRTYGIRGAQTKIEARFAKMTELNKKCIKLAEKQGYIETLPDRTVNPKKGYPLLCSRTEYGKILETTPLNYFVQGTACWWMRQSMRVTHKQLKEWKKEGFNGHITMQVHDSLVFDFPKVGDPRNDIDKSRPDGMKLFRTSNLWRVRKLQQLMSQCGDDIGIPVPVGATYCPESWDQGEEL